MSAILMNVPLPLYLTKNTTKSIKNFNVDMLKTIFSYNILHEVLSLSEL